MVGFRCPEKLSIRIADYAGRRGISKSDAMRELIEKGLASG